MSTLIVFIAVTFTIAVLVELADRYDLEQLDRLLAPKPPAGAPPAGPPRPGLRTVPPGLSSISRGSGHILPRGVADAERGA